MEPSGSFDLIASLSQEVEAKGNYVITINVFNESGMGVRQVDVSVKDNETNDIQSTVFGRIEPGRSDTRTVLLRGGCDQCASKVYPDVGQPSTSIGFGDNVDTVNLHITG